MSTGPRRRSSGRRRGPKRPVDIWRPVPQLPPPEPIHPAADPSAIVRSLGDPPLLGQASVATNYLAAVAEQAAKTASALAYASGLLADEDPNVE